MMSRATSGDADEDYDTFDQNAQLGNVDLSNLEFLSSQVNDGSVVNRRVTSQRLIEPLRTKPVALQSMSGLLDKFSPALFMRW